MPFDLTFKANGNADPQVILLQDEHTRAAYEWDDVVLRVRYGIHRPNGALTVLGEFDSTEIETVTDDGTTWNAVTFEPDPETLLELDSGNYPIDVLTVETTVNEEDEEVISIDNLDDGTMTIRRGVSA